MLVINPMLNPSVVGSALIEDCDFSGNAVLDVGSSFVVSGGFSSYLPFANGESWCDFVIHPHHFSSRFLGLW